jgi:hypothetical protein
MLSSINYNYTIITFILKLYNIKQIRVNIVYNLIAELYIEKQTMEI